MSSDSGASSLSDAEADGILDEVPGRGGVDDPQVWIDRFVAEAAIMAQQSRAAQQMMAEQVFRAENKFMRLTMGAGGQLTEVTFLGSANAATAAQLTEAFHELHTRAAARATQATLDIMATLAGPDDPSMTAIRAAVPDAVREQMAHDQDHPDENPSTAQHDEGELDEPHSPAQAHHTDGPAADHDDLGA